MVARISVGKNLYGALAYNQNKVDEGGAKILSAHLLRYPEDGRFRPDESVRQFLEWMPNHYRTEKPVIHISLNPHPDDVLTDGQLAEIGREYMQRLGYGNQPYLVFNKPGRRITPREALRLELSLPLVNERLWVWVRLAERSTSSNQFVLAPISFVLNPIATAPARHSSAVNIPKFL